MDCLKVLKNHQIFFIIDGLLHFFYYLTYLQNYEFINYPIRLVHIEFEFYEFTFSFFDFIQ